jgi:hypothetical protein
VGKGEREVEILGLGGRAVDTYSCCGFALCNVESIISLDKFRVSTHPVLGEPPVLKYFDRPSNPLPTTHPNTHSCEPVLKYLPSNTRPTNYA